MDEKEILEGLAKIMKAEGWRGATNMAHLIGGNLYLENDHPELNGLIIAANELELWHWDTFKAAYGRVFDKRKKSNTPPKMVEVSVGILLRETDKAYQFSTGKMTNRGRHPELAGVWVPKSQVTYNEQNSTLTMPAWLAVEKNWMR